MVANVTNAQPGIQEGLAQKRASPLILVRPAGRTYLEVKVLYSPGKGKS